MAREAGLTNWTPALPEIDLIGVASGLGGADTGVALAPGLLRRRHLAGRLARTGFAAQWLDELQAPRRAPDPLALVARTCGQLAERVFTSVAANRRFVVVGGDHSHAIGTWSGARRALDPAVPLALIWVDAHMDGHTPQTSHTGNLHGMPLAALLGHGAPELVALEHGKPVLHPAHVCLIGTRSYEPEEAALLRSLGVRIYHMDEVQRRGFGTVLDEAVHRVASGAGALGLSLDLDAFDPAEAPGVSTPEPDGLRAAEVLPALARLAHRDDLVGVEVMELNPERDRNGITAELAINLVTACLTGEVV